MLDHYLDDFIIADKPGSSQCTRSLETALETCEEVGFRVVPEKTEGPTTALTLLGVELDTERLELRLPQKKLLKLRELVEKWRRLLQTGAPITGRLPEPCLQGDKTGSSFSAGGVWVAVEI